MTQCRFRYRPLWNGCQLPQDAVLPPCFRSRVSEKTPHHGLQLAGRFGHVQGCVRSVPNAFRARLISWTRHCARPGSSWSGATPSSSNFDTTSPRTCQGIVPSSFWDRPPVDCGSLVAIWMSVSRYLVWSGAWRRSDYSGGCVPHCTVRRATAQKRDSQRGCRYCGGNPVSLIACRLATLASTTPWRWKTRGSWPRTFLATLGCDPLRLP
mmetsp:Transcript_42946/g.118775  ORF Transcript_42946/g.118775 Transcript_42946/m.118775 type:complete len:210 (-) Transcript_42946:362-991(-)